MPARSPSWLSIRHVSLLAPAARNPFQLAVLGSFQRAARCPFQRTVLCIMIGTAVFIAALVQYPTVAHAQTIQPLREDALKRDDLRKAQKRPYDINRNDCVKDDVLHFSLEVLNPSSDNFQVWVGSTNCTTKEARDGQPRECWKVYDSKAEKRLFDIDIPVRNIVARYGPKDTGATNGLSVGTRDDCDNDAWQGATSLYFMYVNSAGDVTTHAAWSKTNVDIEGPSAPTNVRGFPGDKRVELEWSASNSTDLRGYQFYCAPNTGAASLSVPQTQTPDGGASEGTGGSGSEEEVVDAGSSGDDGAAQATGTSTDAGSTVGSCGALGLVPGTIPTEDLKPCGSEDSSIATSGQASGVSNGIEYAVAVAAVDDLDNPGLLSNVTCATPENITTFFDNYVAGGGKGGGGICAITEAGRPSSGRSGQALFGLLLLGGLFRRRHRSREPGDRPAMFQPIDTRPSK